MNNYVFYFWLETSKDDLIRRYSTAYSDSIHKIIDDKSIENRKKHIEESKNWVELASQKANEELLLMVNANRGDYNPAFIIA